MFMLDPQYILGFVDGEGSFHVAIYKDSHMSSGLKFIPEFHISQNAASKTVLYQINSFFKCGYIKQNHSKNSKDSTYVYVVRNRKDLLNSIIPFFRKHHLFTQKQKDFLLFAKIVEKMENSVHRDIKGAKQILQLAYKMNQQGKYRKIKHVID